MLPLFSFPLFVATCVMLCLSAHRTLKFYKCNLNDNFSHPVATANAVVLLESQHYCSSLDRALLGGMLSFSGGCSRLPKNRNDHSQAKYVSPTKNMRYFA